VRFTNAGIALIKKFEGLRLTSYLCPRKIPTIGFGHTGPDVQLGMTINEREAEQYLAGDLMRFQHGVEEAVTGIPTTDEQFTAMVCLAYNIGMGRFKTSSVLKFHRQGKKLLAANAFLLWVFVNKRRTLGLVRRRNAERALYVS
jgi:lysozyme